MPCLQSGRLRTNVWLLIDAFLPDMLGGDMLGLFLREATTSYTQQFTVAWLQNNLIWINIIKNNRVQAAHNNQSGLKGLGKPYLGGYIKSIYDCRDKYDTCVYSCTPAQNTKSKFKGKAAKGMEQKKAKDAYQLAITISIAVSFILKTF